MAGSRMITALLLHDAEGRPRPGTRGVFPPCFRRGGRRGDPFTVARLRPGDRLVLGCGCGAAATLGRGDLIRLLGAAAPLDLIGLRLRCARCGGPPSGGRFE